MHGLYKELQKHFGSSVQNYLVAARTAQGYEQLAASTHEQRLDVVKRWQATQIALQKEKQHVKQNNSPPPECVFLRLKNATHTSFEERKKRAKNGKLHKTPAHSENPSRVSGASTAPEVTIPADTLAHADTATFEQAILQAVQATSQGDTQQDQAIERAIRASVMELREASKRGNEDQQAIQQAIRASLAEAGRMRKAAPKPTTSTTEDDDHDEDLRLALERSMSSHVTDAGFEAQDVDDSGVNTDDDENMKTALKQSALGDHKGDQEDSQLEMAMKESQLAHDQHTRDISRERTEEEIVLEYVKRQSIEEEEHRRVNALRTGPNSTDAA
ncbi:MAG: hypothetical protein Q9183_001243 [Haloplaca sp. 2 TL-2023]